MSEKQRPAKIVLAYSGGLDTSVMLEWLREKYQCPIVTYTADVGQAEELDGLEEKAAAGGAVASFVEDLREEFVRDFVFEAVKANAVYEGVYLLGTALARPLIARRHVEVARRVGADAVAHGATGKGNDQVRFELAIRALAPDLDVIAPWRSWEFRSRTDLQNYAARRGIDVPTSPAKPYSMDRNLMHVSYEGGVLEDPWQAPPEEMFTLTCSPETAPNRPEEVTVEFADGVAVAVDGRPMGPVELLEHVNRLAGAHGIGRVDMVENRFVGIKSRGVYETPGVTLLHNAHRAIESITMDREMMHLRDSLQTRISELIYNGFWFSPEFEAVKALVDRSQQGVSGTVRLSLYKGNCIVTGRRSPVSLYSPELATFEEDDLYDQQHAEGFIRLHALRLQARPAAGSATTPDKVAAEARLRPVS